MSELAKKKIHIFITVIICLFAHIGNGFFATYCMQPYIGQFVLLWDIVFGYLLGVLAVEYYFKRFPYKFDDED